MSDPIRADVDALRMKLSETVECANTAAGHLLDWSRLGVEPHMSPEITLARIDSLTEVLWAVAKSALDASLAAACVKARVEKL